MNQEFKYKSLKPEINPVKKLRTLSNFVNRVIAGSAMLLLFLYLCAKHNIFIVLMVITLTIGMIYEMIKITRRNDNKPYPINRFLVFFMSAVIYCQITLPTISLYFPKFLRMLKVIHFHPLMCSFYAIGLVSCVTCLKKRVLKQQLLLMTILHMTAYVSGKTATLAIKSVGFGKYFFVYPCLLVISNDIFAYLVGKTIGRTPLISLSPNKTVEGFVGGFFFTFIIGLLMSYLKLKGIFFYDPSHTYLSHSVDPNIQLLNIPLIYLYNIAFVCAASFLAPFCGFIASAIKRSFQKKDFGSIFPGHGGFIDRFDCQIFMMFFTYYFLSVFATPKKVSANLIYRVLLEKLSEEELEKLCNILTKKNI